MTLKELRDVIPSNVKICVKDKQGKVYGGDEVAMRTFWDNWRVVRIRSHNEGLYIDIEEQL